MTVHTTKLTQTSFPLRWQDHWLSGSCQEASMVLLEPVMKVEVSTPDEFMGDIIGDLGSRRAQIQGTNT